CDVEVQLKNTTMGQVTGTLKVGAGDASVTVPLVGGGLGSGWPFFVSQSLDFGAARLGHTVSLKAQVGNSRLDGGSIYTFRASVTGQDFTITGDTCQGATVKPGEACAVEVTFTPTAA